VSGGRDTQKTQNGIETIADAGGATVSTVATPRKPRTGLKPDDDDDKRLVTDGSRHPENPERD